MIVNTYIIKGYSSTTVNQPNFSCFLLYLNKVSGWGVTSAWNLSVMSQTSIKLQLNWDLAEICLEGLMLICLKLVQNKAKFSTQQLNWGLPGWDLVKRITCLSETRLKWAILLFQQLNWDQLPGWDLVRGVMCLSNSSEKSQTPLLGC